MNTGTGRHFDVVAERLDRRIDGLAEALIGVDEKVARRIDQLEERMDRGFAETQAMIIDRRIRTLEQNLARDTLKRSFSDGNAVRREPVVEFPPVAGS